MDLLIMEDSSSPAGGSSTRIHVVYYLNRAGKLDQPHLMEGSLVGGDGFHLKDFKRWLAALRGTGIPDSFSWSYKRNYKKTFIWHDLDDDDLIHPVCNDEYVLMGSEIKDNNSSASSLLLQLLPEMGAAAAQAGKCRSCSTASEQRKPQLTDAAVAAPRTSGSLPAQGSCPPPNHHAKVPRSRSRNSMHWSPGDAAPPHPPPTDTIITVHDVNDMIRHQTAAGEDGDEFGGRVSAAARRSYRSKSAKSCELPESPPANEPPAAVDPDFKRSVPKKSRTINRSLQYISISPRKQLHNTQLLPPPAASGPSTNKQLLTYAPLMYPVKGTVSASAAKLAKLQLASGSAFDSSNGISHVEAIMADGVVDAATQTSKDSCVRGSYAYSNKSSGAPLHRSVLGCGGNTRMNGYGGGEEEREEQEEEEDVLMGTPVKIMLEVGTSPAHSVHDSGHGLGGASKTPQRKKAKSARRRSDPAAADVKPVIRVSSTTPPRSAADQSPNIAGTGRIHVADRYHPSSCNSGTGAAVPSDHHNCCPKIPAAHYLPSNSFRFSVKKNQQCSRGGGSGSSNGNGRTMKGLIGAPHLFWKQLLSCCNLQDVIRKSESAMMCGGSGGRGVRYNNYHYMARSGGGALQHISTPSSWISSNPSSVNDQDRL